MANDASDGDVDVTGLVDLESFDGNSNNLLNSVDANGLLALASFAASSKAVNIVGCSAITSPAITGVTASTVNLAGCTGVNGTILITSCPGITSLDLSPCSGATVLSNGTNTLLASINYTGLSAVTNLGANGCALTAPDISDCVLVTGVSFNNNALTEAAVDAILAVLVTNGLSDGSCDLSGGTNAPPSGTGLANKAVLEGLGWTVTVNSLTPPSNTVAPVISDTGGLMLQLDSAGTWTGFPAPTFDHRQWQADGVDIGGETATTYDASGQSPGVSITCRVFYTNSSGTVGADSNAIVT